MLNPNRVDATDDEATNSPAEAYGGSVVYITVPVANTFITAQSPQFGGIDNTKTYRVQGCYPAATGGNPPDASFRQGELKLINI